MRSTRTPRGILVDRVSADTQRMLTDLRRGRIGRLLLTGGKHHICTGGSQLLGDRQADSARGAGDDRGAAGQVQ